jgi:hypothetical protein
MRGTRVDEEITIEGDPFGPIVTLAPGTELTVGVNGLNVCEVTTNIGVPSIVVICP